MLLPISLKIHFDIPNDGKCTRDRFGAQRVNRRKYYSATRLAPEPVATAPQSSRLWERREKIALRNVIAADRRKCFVQLQEILVRGVISKPLGGTAAVGIAGGSEAGPVVHHVSGKGKFGGSRCVVQTQAWSTDKLQIAEHEVQLGYVPDKFYNASGNRKLTHFTENRGRGNRVVDSRTDASFRLTFSVCQHIIIIAGGTRREWLDREYYEFGAA